MGAGVYCPCLDNGAWRRVFLLWPTEVRKLRRPCVVFAHYMRLY